jgi:hypothetical protein
MNTRMNLIAAFALTLAWAAMAQALALRTFVSTAGDDANDCTFNTPCRNFSGAVPKTEPGGEIVALDSGTYGVVTIDRALTLQAAPGAHVALGGTPRISAAIPVIINAGASDVVVLRNLFISRVGSTLRGIEFNTGGALHIENCIVTGFRGSGIAFNLDGDLCSSAGCPKLFIKDAIVRDNGTGINVAGAIASLDHCRIESNATGVRVRGLSDLWVRDSVIVSSPSVGLRAEAGASVKVENCVFLGNGTGIQGIQNPPPDNGFSSIYVSTTMISANGTGITGGLLISFGNNRLGGNGVNGGFFTTIPEQ